MIPWAWSVNIHVHVHGNDHCSSGIPYQTNNITMSVCLICNYQFQLFMCAFMYKHCTCTL